MQKKLGVRSVYCQTGEEGTNRVFKMYLLLLCVWLHWIFVAVCGISLIVASEGLLYVVVHGLRVADYGFSFCRVQALGV